MEGRTRARCSQSSFPSRKALSRPNHKARSVHSSCSQTSWLVILVPITEVECLTYGGRLLMEQGGEFWGLEIAMVKSLELVINFGLQIEVIGGDWLM